MWDVGWVRLLQPLISVVRAAAQYKTRLSRERQAGRRLFESHEDKLIDAEFDKTIARLRGEEVEDSWLSQIQTFIEHPLITPEFLREQDIRDWLAEDRVHCDLKALASARLLGDVEDDNNVKQRLIQTHSTISGKPKAFAVEAIDSVVAILIAGYRASLKGPLAPLAGLIQAGVTEQREGLGRVSQEISGVGERLDKLGPDNLVVTAHTNQATRELGRILKRRGLFGDRIREEIRVLVQQIVEGDLRYADQGVRTKILSWAARLHTADVQHIPSARSYLGQLRKLDPGYDTRIVDAYIMEREGDIDGALHLLRDINDPDGHSALWSVLSRTRGKEASLLWFEEQPGHEYAGFLTGIGWSNLAISLAEMDEWEKACDLLAGVRGHLVEWPDLAFVEGVINAAMLLPLEVRHLALRMNIFHPQIQTVKGLDVDQRRVRARSCFEQAEKLMIEIGEDKRAEVAKVWLLWLRLGRERTDCRGGTGGSARGHERPCTGC